MLYFSVIWNVKYGLAIDQSRNPNQRSSSWATNYHHPNDDHKQVFLGSVSNISVKNISSPTGGGNLLGQALALPDSRKGCRGWITDFLVHVIFQVGVILTIVTDKTRGQDEHLDDYIRC